MRSRLTKDGARVLTAKIEILLDQDLIATYAMAHPGWSGDPDAFNTIMGLNKREIFAYAKNTIYLGGGGACAHARAIADNSNTWSRNQMERFRDHVSEMFPEID